MTVGLTSWGFLIVGSFAALGAAMAAGTLAALLRHRRTGTLPGSDEVAVITPRRRALLWARVGIGTVLAVAGVVSMLRTGLL
jgi:hypothetical protein